jgi:sugar lactone lactonase YvrE
MHPTAFAAGVAALFYCILSRCARVVLVRCGVALTCALVGVMLPGGIWGQTATLTGIQSTVFSAPAVDPYLLTVDAAGDIFIGDPAAMQVLKVPAGSTKATVFLSNVYPSSLSADPYGDLYLVDQMSKQVLRVPAAGGPPTPVGSGWIAPYGVAYGGDDDIYVSDTALTTVIDVHTGIQGNISQIPVGSGFHFPTAVAVDKKGIVYVVDNDNLRVVAVYPTSYNEPQVTMVSGFSPSSIAVDAFSNVYLADPINSRIVEVPATLQTLDRALLKFGSPATVLTGLTTPRGLAIDPQGGLYVGDYATSRVVRVPQQPGAFAKANICPAGQTSPKPCSQTYTMTFQITPVSTPVAAIALTMGAENLDFSYNPAASFCTTTASTETCSLSVAFAPKYPGLRRGAVQLFDGANGKLLTNVPVSGVGVGPQITFSSAWQTVQSGMDGKGGLFGFSSAAIDNLGNLFSVDQFNNQVVEFHADGSAQSLIGASLKSSRLCGLAVDGAGNLLIADAGNGQIVMVSPEGVMTTLISGLTNLSALAVDGSGDIFFGDSVGVRELTPTGSLTTYSTDPGVYALAVDGEGYIYAAGVLNSSGYIDKIPSGGSGDVVRTSLGSIQPSSIAVDAAGDVFITDPALGQLNELTAGSGSSIPLTSDHELFEGIAIDDGGNLYVTKGDEGIAEFKRSTPPTFNFAATVIGLTSADSAQHTIVQNSGNSTLLFTKPKTGTNPSFTSAFHTDTIGIFQGDSLCISNAGLLPGGTCNVAVDFTPSVVGTNTGSIVFTDNALNVTSAVQEIAATGKALSKAPIVTWATPAPIRSGTALGTVQLNATASTPGTFVYNPPAGVVLTPGPHMLSVTFTPTDNVNYSKATGDVELFVETPIKLTPTISWAASAPITYGTALGTTQLHATASVAGSFAYTSSGSAVAVGTVLGAGSHVLSVTFTPSDTTDYTSATAQVTLVVNPAKLTVTATNAIMTYGQPVPTLAYTVAGFLHGDTSAVASGTPVEATKATNTSPAGSYPITVTQGTFKATNYTFVFVNGTLTVKLIGTALKPTFSTPPGTYSAAQSVALSDSTTGAVIYYTSNGMTPTTASTKYTAAIKVAATQTIEAIAVAPGYANSPVTSSTYTITLKPAIRRPSRIRIEPTPMLSRRRAE